MHLGSVGHCRPTCYPLSFFGFNGFPEALLHCYCAFMHDEEHPALQSTCWTLVMSTGLALEYYGDVNCRTSCSLHVSEFDIPVDSKFVGVEIVGPSVAVK